MSKQLGDAFNIFEMAIILDTYRTLMKDPHNIFIMSKKLSLPEGSIETIVKKVDEEMSQ